METTNNPRPTRTHLTDPRPPLQWLQMSFTQDGFNALKAYRARVSSEEGRPVSLGRALDLMLKAHPFTVDLPRSQR